MPWRAYRRRQPRPTAHMAAGMYVHGSHVKAACPDCMQPRASKQAGISTSTSTTCRYTAQYSDPTNRMHVSTEHSFTSPHTANQGHTAAAHIPSNSHSWHRGPDSQAPNSVFQLCQPASLPCPDPVPRTQYPAQRPVPNAHRKQGSSISERSPRSQASSPPLPAYYPPRGSKRLDPRAGHVRARNRKGTRVYGRTVKTGSIRSAQGARGQKGARSNQCGSIECSGAANRKRWETSGSGRIAGSGEWVDVGGACEAIVAAAAAGTWGGW